MSQKRVKDKMLRPGDFADKAVRPRPDLADIEPARAPETPSLICVKECNVPGVGTWPAGAIITDPDTISKVQGSPYFQPVAATQEGG